MDIIGNYKSVDQTLLLVPEGRLEFYIIYTFER